MIGEPTLTDLRRELEHLYSIERTLVRAKATKETSASLKRTRKSITDMKEEIRLVRLEMGGQ